VTAGPTVGDVGERALLARLRARVPPPPEDVPVGIGDDAAVAKTPRGALDVLTCDALVEGVHFDRAFVEAAAIGHRALAVNLSDLAAMGALPRLALLSLGLPPALPVEDFDAILGGLLDLAARHRVALVGGNLTRSPGPLFVDVTLVGSVKPRRVLRRGGAKPGDELWVSGSIGAGAAGLAWLRRRADLGGAGEALPPSDAVRDAVAWYLRPQPRVRLGVIVARRRAAVACMDLSDGLADAVTQVAAASGVGAVLDAAALPRHPAALELWPGDGSIDASLAGGDDYELLFAVPARRRRTFLAAVAQAGGVPVTRIGVITPPGTGVVVRDGARERPLPSGYAHFA
jgi:thiamine-monophosphate kinase